MNHWFPIWFSCHFHGLITCNILGHKKHESYPGISKELYGIKVFEDHSGCLRCCCPIWREEDVT